VRFAKTHEWIRTEGDGVATFGISQFAANALGEVVYCDLPSEGATFSASETVATLESVKAVGEVYAPADLEVIAVNEQLAEDPSAVNSSPEADGWLVKVKYTGDLSSMMDRAAYDKFAEAESQSE
jgi:glycine cleavage system H protein